ncbi:nickel/cobalt transporter [Lichenihabitans psoromatis]|uniref:nickel/cobalt transporter n=1 Tax=Lichenihabitans psoromatis TaxID=2528642 RepID=UPI001FE17707|nr:nickel/cobalt transporter [Lichenihabitans psoromatis]
MNSKMARLATCFGALAVACIASRTPALAQAHNPFSVGISEGGGSASGIAGWLLAKQAAYEQMLSGAVRAAKADGSALWILSGLSFLYGVFHAAGPGHGKAVVASYMFANERALRRGVIISFLAAALQGVVAIALIGVLALVFHATAQVMKDAARIVESLSYAGIALLGLWLVWRKGVAFLRAWRAHARPSGGDTSISAPGHARPPANESMAVVESDHRHDHDEACRSSHGLGHVSHPIVPLAHTPHGVAGHVHDDHCGHFHAPDPATLGDQFSWTSALMTVVAAGLRPCSGAILVLVFALAQGYFLAGVAATLAMSLGTAITTSALACLAVLAGGLAVRLSGGGSRRGELVLRALEAGAGALILLLGIGLFLGVMSTGA